MTDDAVWKGLPRELVEGWIAETLGGACIGDGPEDAALVIEQLGLRCVGWHDWTGDPTTSTPLFVLDAWAPPVATIDADEATMLQEGDRVLVTVFGKRWAATVTQPRSRTGAVQVRLDTTLWIEGVGHETLYRAPSDVEKVP